MKPKFARLAAVGALGVCAGVLLTYAAVVWIGRTTAVAGAPGATGGIDTITRNVLWIAALVPTVIFVWSHLAFARQLRRGPSSPHE